MIENAMRAAALAALMMGLATTSACRDDGPEATGSGARASGTSASGTSAARPAAFDSRSQYDLAAALTQVEKSRDPDGVAIGYQKIRASWAGKRYRWRVHVIEPLCRTRDACNVLPFDLGGRDKGTVHGWMPHLVLDDAGFAAIRRTCAGKLSCQIEMEGTLSQFVLDTEYPTSLEFRQVRVM